MSEDLPSPANAACTCIEPTSCSDAAERLKATQGIKRVAIAGDLRRGCELIGYLALVAEAGIAASETQASPIFTEHPGDFGCGPGRHFPQPFLPPHNVLSGPTLP
jgi:hypothetical protein